MKNTESYSALLFKYFAGELSEIEEQELLSWLKESDENMLLLSEMSDWWAVAHVPLFSADMEADFTAHFSTLVKVPKATVTGKLLPGYTKLQKWISVAAVILLFVTVGVSAFLAGEYQGEAHGLAYMETSTPYGAQSKIELPDGSSVTLNAGSSLKYKSDFNQTDRRVELTGEAYFEIRKDTLKPFIVCSDKLDVRVLGTSFNVKAYKNEETIDVVLVSGKVDVQFPGQQQHDVFLSPNECLSYNKAEEVTTVSVVNSANSILWTKGIYQFYEKTFPQIARELERKYAVSIEVRSAVLPAEIFSGSFSSHYSLNEVMTEMDMENKYKWFYENDKLIITDK